MRLIKLVKERWDREIIGISPVVGVTLMIAITVALAAVIGIVVFNVGQTPSSGGSVGVETMERNGETTVSLNSGQFDAFDYIYVVGGSNTTYSGGVSISDYSNGPSDPSQYLYTGSEGGAGTQIIVNTKNESSNGNIRIIGVTKDGNEQLIRDISYTESTVQESQNSPQTPIQNISSMVTAPSPQEIATVHSQLAGDGSSGNPYEISNIYELQSVTENLTANYIIVNDINATVTNGWNTTNGFTPIGSVTPFSGSLIGQSYQVNGLYINQGTTDNIGLFSQMNGEVSDITFENLNILGNNSVGGITGRMDGSQATVSQVSILSGNVSGNNDVGGIAGVTSGSISQSTAASEVYGNENIGGVVGTIDFGEVTDSQSTGRVMGYEDIGGIAGENSDGDILRSSSGSQSIIAEYGGGGIVGYNNNGILQDVSSDSLVDTNWRWSGGIIGYNSGTVTTPESTGTVQSVYFSGGVVGYNTGTVQNAYSTSTVDATYESGGIIGYNDGSLISSTADAVTVSGFEQVGGLVGNNSPAGIITGSNAAGNVDGNKVIGGLVGRNIGVVESSSAAVDTSAMGDFVGGYIGENYHNIGNATATGQVTGKNKVGGFVGSNYAQMTNVSATGTVTGSSQVGGLVGLNNNDGGQIKNSHSVGDVEGDFTVGGFSGNNYGTITDSYSTGSVTSIGDTRRTGGFVGQNAANISNSYADATTTGNNTVGGFVGTNLNNGVIQYSSSNGYVNGTDVWTGGFAGLNSETITLSYTTVDVTGNSQVGGFVGSNSDTILNSYANGTVTGVNLVGGFAGTVSSNQNNISMSYAVGNVTAYGNYVSGFANGGYVGELSSETTEGINRYWDINATGQTDSAAGKGLKTSQMTGPNADNAMDFDFTTVWTTTSTYPKLQWESE